MYCSHSIIFIHGLVSRCLSRPTRAEATDVANAVLDGADGFLLGAETLRGQYAVETVSTIMSISNQAELMFDHVQHFDYLMQVGGSS